MLNGFLRFVKKMLAFLTLLTLFIAFMYGVVMLVGGASGWYLMFVFVPGLVLWFVLMPLFGVIVEGDGSYTHPQDPRGDL